MKTSCRFAAVPKPTVRHDPTVAGEPPGSRELHAPICSRTTRVKDGCGRMPYDSNSAFDDSNDFSREADDLPLPFQRPVPGPRLVRIPPHSEESRYLPPPPPGCQAPPSAFSRVPADCSQTESARTFECGRRPSPTSVKLCCLAASRPLLPEPSVRPIVTALFLPSLPFDTSGPISEPLPDGTTATGRVAPTGRSPPRRPGSFLTPHPS